MKGIFLSVALMVLSIPALAQAPESFNYQVVVRDGSTISPLVNQNVSFRMSILKGSSSGESQYSELHSANTGALGIVNLVIGNGTGKTGDITTINWGADTYFLKVEIDKTGGTSYVEMGTTQLLSVPYALHSKSSETSVDAVKITGDQTITGNKTFTGTTSVQSPVNELDASTKEYVDGIKAQMKAMEYMLIKTNQYKLMDIDDNQYNVVIIGTQIWMAENLKTTRYNDGTTIDYPGTDNTAWANNTTGAYAWFGNDEATFKSTYGALYNYYAVSTGKLCPTVWHAPSDEEWTILENYLIVNGYNYDGTTTGNKIAKAMATIPGPSSWAGSTNTGVPGNNDYPLYINKSGFTALPGGGRTSTGTFSDLHDLGLWWSSSMIKTSSYNTYIGHNQPQVERGMVSRKSGFSVRCIKD
jgi:uncharacterized protein (TIGR02145 family)